MTVPDTNIKNLLENLVVKISTPNSWGIGIVLKIHNIIVTNEHIVKGQKSVIIEGKYFDKKVVKVLYLDSKYDIAFLEFPPTCNDSVSTISLKYESSEGASYFSWDCKHNEIFKVSFNEKLHSHHNDFCFSDVHKPLKNIAYGPVICDKGNLIGIFVYTNKDTQINILKAHVIDDILQNYLKYKGKIGVRCPHCTLIIYDEVHLKPTCSHCKNQLFELMNENEWPPMGINRIIEEVIVSLGYALPLVRQGLNNWVLPSGSSRLKISYSEKNGIIVADAYLCSLPLENLDSIYLYLLNQNNILNGINFSLNSKNIILSLIIFEQYLNTITLKTMLENLLIQANKYDDILVEKFGAQW